MWRSPTNWISSWLRYKTANITQGLKIHFLTCFLFLSWHFWSLVLKEHSVDFENLCVCMCLHRSSAMTWHWCDEAETIIKGRTNEAFHLILSSARFYSSSILFETRARDQGRDMFHVNCSSLVVLFPFLCLVSLIASRRKRKKGNGLDIIWRMYDPIALVKLIISILLRLLCQMRS